MPLTAKPNELKFLRELDAWIARGLPAYQFAEQQGITPGTITYRLRAFGLVAKRAVGLVDARDERPLQALLDAGEILLTEPTSAAA